MMKKSSTGVMNGLGLDAPSPSEMAEGGADGDSGAVESGVDEPVEDVPVEDFEPHAAASAEPDIVAAPAEMTVMKRRREITPRF